MNDFKFFRGVEKNWVSSIENSIIRNYVEEYFIRRSNQRNNVFNFDFDSILYPQINRRGIPSERIYFGGIDPSDPLDENTTPIIFTATQVNR